MLKKKIKNKLLEKRYLSINDCRHRKHIVLSDKSYYIDIVVRECKPFDQTHYSFTFIINDDKYKKIKRYVYQISHNTNLDRFFKKIESSLFCYIENNIV